MADNDSGAPPQGDQQGGPGDQSNDQAPNPEQLRAELAEARQSDRNRAGRIRQLETELEQLKAKSMTDAEKAIEEAKKSARAEADQDWSGKYLGLRVERLAATRLADPGDATALIDMSSLTPDSDDKAINGLIDKLLESKPYLAPQSANGHGGPQLDRGPQGSGSSKSANDMNAFLRTKAGR